MRGVFATRLPGVIGERTLDERPRLFGVSRLRWVLRDVSANCGQVTAVVDIAHPVASRPGCARSLALRRLVLRAIGVPTEFGKSSGAGGLQLGDEHFGRKWGRCRQEVHGVGQDAKAPDGEPATSAVAGDAESDGPSLLAVESHWLTSERLLRTLSPATVVGLLRDRCGGFDPRWRAVPGNRRNTHRVRLRPSRIVGQPEAIARERGMPGEHGSDATKATAGMQALITTSTTR